MSTKAPHHIFQFNVLNLLVIDDEVRLDSEFAVDQLQRIAQKDSLAMFMAAFMDIFGTDIPAQAYEALYFDAQEKAPHLIPTIVVQEKISQGSGKAAFFNNGEIQEIWVAEDIVLEAVEDNDLRGELMTMLVEEYGHFLDYLLRNHYADTPIKDAPADEGAAFAYSVYTLNPVEQSDQYFAEATIDGEETPLTWDFSELNNNLKEYVNEERQQQDDNYGDLEFYKAGYIKLHGKHGHGDISKKALAPLLSKKTNLAETKRLTTLDTIYLGNWLRDFSQIVDPMTVRPLATASQSLGSTAQKKGTAQSQPKQKSETSNENKTTLDESSTASMTLPTGIELNGLFGFKAASKTVQFHPVMLSVEALTTAVELGAVKEFIHKKDLKEENIEDYKGHIEKLRKEFIAITPDVLGVYRPEEHIDNPFGLGQNEEGLSRGDKQLYSKFVGFMPNNHALHEINTDFGMKNYIRSNETYQVEGDSYPTAYDFIVDKLRNAGQPGGLKNSDCLVDFGAALHTLEDYFAHTNYAELCLIKSVEPFVFPWVDEVTVNGTTFSYNYQELYDGKGFDEKYCILKRDSLHIGNHPNNRLATYIPIVTGTFGLIDTAASVLPVLNHVLFNLELTPWEKTEPGVRTFNDILILEVLKDIDSAQTGEEPGTNKDTYAGAFETLLDIRDWMTFVSNALIPPAVKKAFHWISQRIGLMLNFTQYFMIKAIAANLGDAQVLLNKELELMELGQFHIGTNPSHTQVAKDDPHAPMHELSSVLAIDAVKQIGEKMLDVWNGKAHVDEVISVLDKIMRHPATTQWQDPIVQEWANQNQSTICQASTPSAVIERTFHALEEVDETLELIDQYINDEKTMKILESLDIHFSDDTETNADKGTLLKSYIQKALKVSQEQRSRLEALKYKWDSKYPKPSSCKINDAIINSPPADQHSSNSTKTDHTHDHEKTTAQLKTKEKPPKTQHHLIEYGDTLSAIAIRYNTTVKQLKSLNGLSGDTIYAGQQLIVPEQKPTN